MKNKVCKVWKWNVKTKIRQYKYKEQEWYLTQSLTTLKKHWVILKLFTFTLCSDQNASMTHLLFNPYNLFLHGFQVGFQ